MGRTFFGLVHHGFARVTHLTEGVLGGVTDLLGRRLLGLLRYVLGESVYTSPRKNTHGLNGRGNIICLASHLVPCLLSAGLLLVGLNGLSILEDFHLPQKIRRTLRAEPAWPVNDSRVLSDIAYSKYCWSFYDGVGRSGSAGGIGVKAGNLT